MAKRRTKKQISIDKIVYDALHDWGYLVLDDAKPFSRYADGRLRDEMNFDHPSDTSIRFYQLWYGAGLTPITEPNPYGYPRNALKIVIDEKIKENTNNIIKKINASIFENNGFDINQ